MLSRLLPHTVTYYRAVECEDDAECGFERYVFTPVRLRVTREQSADGHTVEVLGVLYLFPREMGRGVPSLHADRDFFVAGVCESDAPPRDGSPAQDLSASHDGTVYRVSGVSEFVGVDELKYIRVIGKAMGGESV